MSSATSPQTKSDSSDSGQIDDSTSYRLAVMSAPADHDAALAVLQETLGLNAIDARTRLRHVPAVWPDNVDETAAQEAALRLQSLGTSAAAVPTADVPDLRSARKLHHVQCREEGFVIMSISGEDERTIDWGDVAMLSVADVSGLRQTTVNRLPNGVFRHPIGISQRMVWTDEHGLEMWLICDSPFQAYRIDAELMNYEYLGPRRSRATDENFSNLVGDIRQHAGHLSLTPSAQAYVDDPTRGFQRVPSPEAHRDSVVGQWVILHATRDRRPALPSAPPRETTVTSKSPMCDDPLYQTHQQLHEEIDAFRTNRRDHSESDPSAQSVLMSEIETLRTTIAKHFALEEDGGYMRSVLDAAPRYARLAESLQQQHSALREQLEQLIESSDDLANGIQNFIEELEAHEHAENALVQSAYLDDIAAGD